MKLQHAAMAAAAVSPGQMRRGYRQAIWQGEANTQCSAGQERGYGALRLLTLAMLRLPELYLYAHLTHACEDELSEHGEDEPQRASVLVLVLGAVADNAAGALRLAHRALETHGCALHYEIAAWVTRALDRAREQLEHGAAADDDDGLADGIALDQARLAAVALTRATAATSGDPMQVADQIAHGLGHLLAVYLITREAGG